MYESYYEMNIENCVPKTLLEEIELLEKLFIWQESYLGQPVQAELLTKYLNKDFLDNCAKANMLFSYDDTPQFVYMDHEKVGEFKSFVKENY